MQLSVRAVDERIFRRFKADAVQRGLPLGKALTVAMNQWIAEGRGKKSILDFKPERWGKGSEHLSRDTDILLYGE